MAERLIDAVHTGMGWIRATLVGRSRRFDSRPTPELLDDRREGVQVIIVSPDGKIFLRPETEEKRELHLRGGATEMLSSLGRMNAAGGGIHNGELVLRAALREMQTELDPRLGAGTFNHFDRVPLIACYQEIETPSGVLAYLIGVHLVEYVATPAEMEILRRIPEAGFLGWFDAEYEVHTTSDFQDDDLNYRPTFRQGLFVYTSLKHNGVDPKQLIAGYNRDVVEFGYQRARELGLTFYPGMYTGNGLRKN